MSSGVRPISRAAGQTVAPPGALVIFTLPPRNSNAAAAGLCAPRLHRPPLLRPRAVAGRRSRARLPRASSSTGATPARLPSTKISAPGGVLRDGDACPTRTRSPRRVVSPRLISSVRALLAPVELHHELVLAGRQIGERRGSRAAFTTRIALPHLEGRARRSATPAPPRRGSAASRSGAGCASASARDLELHVLRLVAREHDARGVSAQPAGRRNSAGLRRIRAVEHDHRARRLRLDAARRRAPLLPVSK